ncbi:zinc metalloprotease [Streptosporangium carneum]|uniref:Zinc metalloprotease n=1 Tax=Streptosporangium carneum TaxID=47481 RepID=A0A9W6ID52_9ACTN|nr:zinc metalloprotease [Streptosporangium carneum]
MTVVAMGASALTGGTEASAAAAAPAAEAVLAARQAGPDTPPAFAPPGPEARRRAVAVAGEALTTRAPELRVGPWDAFERPVITSGIRGLQYLRYPRTHRGLPVYGGDVIVALDSGGTVVHSVTTGQRTVLDVGVRARTSAETAATTARAELAAVRDVGTPALVVHAVTERPRLAWEVAVTGGTDQAPKALRVFVDANDGTVLGSHDQIRYGTGNSHFNGNPVTIQTLRSGSSYTLTDPTRPGLRCTTSNGGVFTKATDTWGNGTALNLETACVDVLFAAQKHWDMLRAWLGRNGVDAAGRTFPAKVGLNQVNSYWDGSSVVFGFNQPHTKQLTSLDMVGHEYGHAVFDHSGANTWNEPEEEALAESAGDIFGTLTEHYVNHPVALDEPDYLLGEEVNPLGSGPIRNMFNPALQGEPNCYTRSTFSGGPHNHWFYLLAEGTNPPGRPSSPVCGGPSSLTGIGLRKAAEIYYTGLQSKTAPWSYAKSRRATVQAAKILYPKSCVELDATKAAWYAIGVPPQAGEPTCTLPTPPPSPAPLSPPGSSASSALPNSLGGITVTPPYVKIPPGGSATVQISLTPYPSAPFTLSVSGLPSGVTVNFFTLGQSTTAVIALSAGTPPGTYILTFTASPTDPIRRTSLTLEVSEEDD